jgi:small-conductance mechanosensitive channel
MRGQTLRALFCAVNSVLAIGGVGGLAVGLAGREILENLFTGLIILSSSPFEVGDEVLFSPPSGQVRRCQCLWSPLY